MRLFVAVDLAEPLRRAVARTADRLRDCGVDDPPRTIKWVDPANLHVTLHFLGEVARSRVPALLQALSPPLAAPSFDMGVGRAGVFPLRGGPRVIWIGITPGAVALEAVHRELAARLAVGAFAIDDRPLQAHVTIARVRQPPRADLRVLVAGAVIDDVGLCRVTAATLYRSHLGPGGPAYEPQLRIPFGCA